MIVEAGAHTGADTRVMARRWRTATIHAFEPVPALFARLEENVGDLRRVHCHRLALAGVTGELQMWVSAGASDGSSSLRAPKHHLTDHPDVRFPTLANVRAMRLDDWAAEHDVQPNALWLDLQGAELDALVGAEGVLTRVQLIHTEVNVIEEYEGCALYPEVRSWLDERGFDVSAEALPQGSSQGNVLFTRRPA